MKNNQKYFYKNTYTQMVHATQLQESLSEQSISQLASRLALLPELSLPPSYLR